MARAPERLPSVLAVTILHEPGRAVVSLHGELDIAEVDRFAELVDPVTDDGGQVVVDMAGLSFLDSTGLGALLRSWRRTEAAGGVLTLRDPCARVRRVLTLTRVDAVLRIEAEAS